MVHSLTSIPGDIATDIEPTIVPIYIRRKITQVSLRFDLVMDSKKWDKARTNDKSQDIYMRAVP